MSSLKDVAQYVRSKNAGPFWVTIDIFCGSREAFDRIRKAPGLTAAEIADVYGVEVSQVRVFVDASLNVVKASFPRVVAQGSQRDPDSHAGQYFVRLLGVPVP